MFLRWRAAWASASKKMPISALSAQGRRRRSGDIFCKNRSCRKIKTENQGSQSNTCTPMPQMEGREKETGQRTARRQCQFLSIGTSNHTYFLTGSGKYVPTSYWVKFLVPILERLTNRQKGALTPTPFPAGYYSNVSNSCLGQCFVPLYGRSTKRSSWALIQKIVTPPSFFLAGSGHFFRSVPRPNIRDELSA